ncbi:imidazole glycerol phosphate synthase subunit HisH, partial [Nostoc sp. CHAB 5834]|nr:imidazole glycerol phosphate synthase subunit HisH [Nostoc sp. CHAB 5834]
PDVILKASKLILPGVGHFANGIKKLKESGIWDVLNQAVLVNKTPILGICLGMQLMAGHSEEGDAEGLGWFDADVVRFTVTDPLRFKVPHMGWNTAEQAKESRLVENVPAEAMFYFVHSYHMVCRQPADVLAETTYDYAFVSAIEKGNIYGTQYHPEKSHDWGEQLFTNFIGL